MAGTSLLVLIDDIASTLDDVAVLTKVAAKKTAGVLGDDLALNAEQVTGVNADRELPVVWAVAKGSFVNKVILIPVALLVSQFVPALITPLLMLGGLYLCFEGFEKVAEKLFHHHEPGEPEAAVKHVSATPTQDDLQSYERSRVKGAIRTDFVLSAEIIVITLGTVAGTPLMNQILVLCSIGVAMTVGVYGLVALIVKLDDIGLWLMRTRQGAGRAFGQVLIKTAPVVMKFLGIAGTIAMFMVGGGIITHGLPVLHHFIETLSIPWNFAAEIFTGVSAGGLVVGAWTLAQKLKRA